MTAKYRKINFSDIFTQLTQICPKRTHWTIYQFINTQCWPTLNISTAFSSNSAEGKVVNGLVKKSLLCSNKGCFQYTASKLIQYYSNKHVVDIIIYIHKKCSAWHSKCQVWQIWTLYPSSRLWWSIWLSPGYWCRVNVIQDIKIKFNHSYFWEIPAEFLIKKKQF